jgi:hypothetical protein
MAILGVVCLLALLVGAFAKIAGAEKAASNLVTLGIVLAFAAPIVVCLALPLASGLAVLLKDNIAVLIIGFLALTVVAWIRFVNRKRRLDHWWKTPPVGTKKRIEED